MMCSYLLLSTYCWESFVIGMCAIAVATGTVWLYAWVFAFITMAYVMKVMTYSSPS